MAIVFIIGVLFLFAVPPISIFDKHLKVTSGLYHTLSLALELEKKYSVIHTQQLKKKLASN